MAGTKEIKRRIKSVKNTKKITKAMELVAASKMKRAVSKTLASRIYAKYSWEILSSLSSKIDENITHPFLTEKEEGKNLFIVITSNKGLCGGYNSQVLKKAIYGLKNLNKDEEIDILTIGKKGDSFLRRTGKNIVASFFEIPDIINLSDISPISEFITKEYKNNIYKNVFIVYTDFISALSQKPKLRKLLPVSKKELKESIEDIGEEKSHETLEENKDYSSYLLEGNKEELIESICEKLINMQIYQIILESNASEQSSRMISMKNAGEAAEEMINDLTLVFNKARQSNITREISEISEISAGMASIE